MALHVFVMSIMAYSLSRRNFALRRVFTFLAFFTMLFNGGIVPTYLLITKYLQLKNTYWVYILPSLASAWNLIVLRTNFQQLPDALVESAKIDGASEYRICFSIVTQRFTISEIYGQSGLHFQSNVRKGIFPTVQLIQVLDFL